MGVKVNYFTQRAQDREDNGVVPTEGDDTRMRLAVERESLGEGGTVGRFIRD